MDLLQVSLAAKTGEGKKARERESLSLFFLPPFLPRERLVASPLKGRFHSYLYPDKQIFVSPQKSFSFPRSHFSNTSYGEKHLNRFQFKYTLLSYACWPKGCKFSLLSAGCSLMSIDGFLRVALRLEFEHSVVLVFSCVHDRLRPREMIGFTDNPRFLSWIHFRDKVMSFRSVIWGRFELF